MIYPTSISFTKKCFGESDFDHSIIIRGNSFKEHLIYFCDLLQPSHNLERLAKVSGHFPSSQASSDILYLHSISDSYLVDDSINSKTFVSF